jgi:murein DD-endopeptidase MepM/ murein hydrolase activator NlpD
MNKASLAITLWLLSGLAQGAGVLPQHSPVPGGIAIISLEDITSKTRPKVQYDGKHVLVTKKNNLWYAVVGIPLSAKPGAHSVEVEASAKKEFSFQVSSKNYAEQHITVKNKRHVSPNTQDLKRIRGETKHINTALSTWTDQAYVQLDLILPVKGELSSPFGLRRFFNDQPRKPHSGLDIAAPEGTDIMAPAHGTIINTGDYFFNGNSVFIDHGQGMITMYCHMQRIDVKAGQKVSQGEIIGAVGKTGRVTGPHLHWSISLNDARIDPSLFFPGLINK